MDNQGYIMNKQIEYYIKDVYGRPTKYIKDKAQAKLISDLTGRKTLSLTDTRSLKELGFTLTEVTRP